MALDGLLTYINTLFPVSPSLVKALNERIILTEFKKGDIIASPGRRADEIWFIAKGLAKEYHLEQTGKTVITTFWKENELMLIADSFFQKHRSDRYIQLIEDSILFNLESKHAHELLHLFPEIHTIQHKIHSISKRKAEDRGSLMTMNGSARYRFFCENFPHSRISIADTASYLGLTRVGLSQIRGRK
jgi:CRP-like cAMP-binding protein